MRANRYLQHIAVICATLLFLILCQTAAAEPHNKRWGPPKKPYLVSRLYVKIWKLNKIVANQQETIEQQEARIEELEDMLENFAAVPQTGQTVSNASGDDGDLQMGVQWPDPRFSDNGDGTVTDHLTGLIWLKNANCFGGKGWGDALDSCNKLADGQCGLSDGSSPEDWRLPNIRELHSLTDYGNDLPALPSGHPFVEVQSDYYWSSTTHAQYIDHAYHLYMGRGALYLDGKYYNYLAWPVRSDN